MTNFRTIVIVAISGVSTFTAIGLGSQVIQAQTPPQIVASTNVGLVPGTSREILAPVDPTASPPGTSYTDAIVVAKREFSVQDREIDPDVGVVRALASIQGDQRHQREQVWIVTVDRNIPSPAPWMQNEVFRRLCIVVSAATGQYEYAYLADLQPV